MSSVSDRAIILSPELTRGTPGSNAKEETSVNKIIDRLAMAAANTIQPHRAA
jgi:hypothetical protein